MAGVALCPWLPAASKAHGSLCVSGRVSSRATDDMTRANCGVDEVASSLQKEMCTNLAT